MEEIIGEQLKGGKGSGMEETTPTGPAFNHFSSIVVANGGGRVCLHEQGVFVVVQKNVQGGIARREAGEAPLSRVLGVAVSPLQGTKAARQCG